MEEDVFGDLKKSSSLTNFQSHNQNPYRLNIASSSSSYSLQDDGGMEEGSGENDDFYSPRLKKAASLNFTEGLDLSHINLEKIVLKKPLHKRSILNSFQEDDAETHRSPTMLAPTITPLPPPISPRSAATKSPTLSSNRGERPIEANLLDLTGQLLLRIVSGKELCKKGSPSSDSPFLLCCSFYLFYFSPPLEISGVLMRTKCNRNL